MTNDSAEWICNTWYKVPMVGEPDIIDKLLTACYTKLGPEYNPDGAIDSHYASPLGIWRFDTVDYQGMSENIMFSFKNESDKVEFVLREL